MTSPDPVPEAAAGTPENQIVVPPPRLERDPGSLEAVKREIADLVRQLKDANPRDSARLARDVLVKSAELRMLKG